MLVREVSECVGLPYVASVEMDTFAGPRDMSGKAFGGDRAQNAKNRRRVKRKVPAGFDDEPQCNKMARHPERVAQDPPEMARHTSSL